MRKIAATYIFPLHQKPIKNGIIYCENDGTIIELIDKGDNFAEEAGLEYYSGIIVPGFVLQAQNIEISNKNLARKLWANGISFVTNLEGEVGLACERSGFVRNNLKVTVDELHTPSDISFSGNELLSSGVVNIFQKYQPLNFGGGLNELFCLCCLIESIKCGVSHKFGSFETGKKPGINLLTGVDFKKMEITSGVKIKRLA